MSGKMSPDIRRSFIGLFSRTLSDSSIKGLVAFLSRRLLRWPLVWTLINCFRLLSPYSRGLFGAIEPARFVKRFLVGISVKLSLLGLCWIDGRCCTEFSGNSNDSGGFAVRRSGKSCSTLSGACCIDWLLPLFWY